MKVFIGIMASIIVIAIIILVITRAIIPSKKRKYLAFVLEHSIAIKEIKEINRKFAFSHINNMDEQHEYDNKVFYDNISCEDYLIYQLQFKWRTAIDEIKHAKQNAEKYVQYQEEIKNKCALGQYDVSVGRFNYKKLFEYEKSEIKTYLQKPTTRFSITVTLWLTDLNNYHHYGEKSKIFYEDSIQMIVKRLNNKTGTFYLDKDIWDAICRVERGRVSNKMRFSIMERDGWRCKYCGKIDTGNNLEIDHIIPIAKGGKSTYDNLQTLCHDCNVRKGDTIIKH